jgi:lysophospholipase L1-like esterase
VLASPAGMPPEVPNPVRSFAVACGLAAATACGGGSSSGGGPSGPSVPTYAVAVTVFYDQNANGQLDGNENARVPGVEVVIGTGSAASAPGSGVANVTGIQEGALSVGVRADSLPSYYQAPAPAPIQVPGPTEARIGLMLPIGENNPNLYLAVGDSITAGDGSSDGQGFRLKLQSLLGAHFARAEVQARGRSGDSSAETAEVIRRTLRDHDPAYTLVLLGTNDWHDQTCQSFGPAECFTIESLRTIVEEVRDWRSLPVLATIPPANPAYSTAARDAFYDQTNVGIKALAREMSVTLADLNADFKAAGSLSGLFTDDVHPNDAGYQVLAEGWFKAVSRARSAAASSSPRFGFPARR